MRALFVPVSVALLVAAPGLTLAQTNDQFYRSWRWSATQAPARVAGLAGAFVAVADDTAAVVFNPAGLVQLQKTELLGGVLARVSGTTGSSAGDRLRAVTGLGFAGAAGALSSRWRIGGYMVQPQDRRTSLTAFPLPDGTVAAGFLDTQVTEVGGSVAWALTSRLSLGARVTGTHLRLEGAERRTGPGELNVGSAAGETRVTGSFGGLLTVGRRLQIASAANRELPTVSTGSRIGRDNLRILGLKSLRQPGLLAFGVAYQVSPRLLIVAQADYIRSSEISRELVVRTGPSVSSDYTLGDALEPRVGVEAAFPHRTFSIQVRGGVHSQAPGFLAYRGAFIGRCGYVQGRQSSPCASLWWIGRDARRTEAGPSSTPRRRAGYGPRDRWIAILRAAIARLEKADPKRHFSRVSSTEEAAVHPSLMDCPDCDRPVSREAFACPGCGKPFRTDPRREGPYLRTMNVMTVAALWLIGIPLAFAAIVTSRQAR